MWRLLIVWVAQVFCASWIGRLALRGEWGWVAIALIATALMTVLVVKELRRL